MILRRGDVHWADPRHLEGSEAAGTPFRPVAILQLDRLRYGRTLLSVPLTTSAGRMKAPGAVAVPSGERNNLPEFSVATPHLLVALDGSRMRERIGALQPATVERIGEAVTHLVDSR